MMRNHTSFKIGGPADLFIYVNKKESLKLLLKLINEKNIPFFVLGNGSNLLVADEGFRGVVLSLTGDFKTIILKNGNEITCGAGALLAKACVFAMQNSFSGLEFAYGIPGSCGGALFMNAGAYGHDISDVIKKSTHINLDGSEETLNKNELEFSYRKSFYSNKSCVITSLTFELKPSSSESIKSKMHELMLKRKTKQPLEYPSAGSIFKRPGNGYYVGPLIEQSELKGVSAGGAMVSMKHAGFIINKGGATAKDVLDLVSLIKEKVYEKSGIILECEVKTLGNIKI